VGHVADEAYWPGDKSAEGSLKRMITEPTLFIERKGVDGHEVPNALKIVMATNEGWAVPAGIDERRFAVFEVSGEVKQDVDYFTELYAEIANGAPAAMMHELLALDLGGWHPRQGVPQTEALRQQKLRSLPPEDEWWVSIIDQGWLPGADGQDPACAQSSRLYEHARRTVPRLRYHTDRRLSDILKNPRYGGAISARIGIHRLAGWRFPDLKGRRALWADILDLSAEEMEAGWQPAPLQPF
jgi:uncharacterized protein DUF5906